MNFFDFATLARRKESSIFPASITLSSMKDFDRIQSQKTPSSNCLQNDNKAFELIKTINEELDRLTNESEQQNSELDSIIDDLTQLNKNMEILFGSVISDLNE